MRVLLLNQYYHPDEAATAQLASSLGADLARRGHEVWAIASARPYAGDAGRARPTAELADGVQIRRVRATALGRASLGARLADYGSFFFGAGVALADVPRPDVVVVLSTPPFLVALAELARRFHGARLVYWVMDLYPEVAIALGALSADAPATRFLRHLHGGLLRRADGVIALDDVMRERLLAAGARSERTRVIDNWSATDEAPPLATSDSQLRRSLAPGDRFVVGYSGNFGLGHDFASLIAAAERLRADDRYVWLFIGDGPQRARVSAFVDANPGRAHLLPPRPLDELPDALAACDAIYISLRDGLEGMIVPSKVYGALAAARPIVYVGPPRGRVAELVDVHALGVSARGGDVDGLCEGLGRLSASPAECAAIGARGRALFEARFRKAAALEAHHRLLVEVASA